MAVIDGFKNRGVAPNNRGFLYGGFRNRGASSTNRGILNGGY